MQLRPKGSADFKARLRQWVSIRDTHLLDLLRGASVAGLLRALGAGLTFGLTVALGRVLGAEATGVYFLAFTIATTVAIVGRLGLDNAVLRFVAAHASADKWPTAVRAYRATLTIGLIGSGLVAVALYFAAHFLASSVFSDPELATPIRIMAIAVVPYSLGMLISKALLGLSSVRDSTLVFNIIPQGVALAGTLLLASSWSTISGSIRELLFQLRADSSITIASLFTTRPQPGQGS